MPDLITDPDQLTAERLTRILRAQGVLDRGEVTALQQRSQASITASIVQFEVAYSDAVPPDAPTRLFLKLGGRRIEVEFYNLIAPSMPEAPVLRCYEAVFSPEAGRSHLLFDDLSATHGVPEGALPPPLADTECMVDALAQVHGHWWEHPRLGGDIAAAGEDVPAYVLSVATAALPDFVDLLGDRLSSERRAIYERLLAVWPPPGLAERRATGQAVTLIHGDTHFWNFLVPRSPGADQVRIIDWAVWHIGAGPTDLAYMLAMFWFPERRARMEQRLVRRYHDRLLGYGVKGYGWDQCWLDYRTAAIFNLFWPIFWHRYLPQEIWWHTLEKGMLAFEDLGCAELLDWRI